MKKYISLDRLPLYMFPKPIGKAVEIWEDVNNYYIHDGKLLKEAGIENGLIKGYTCCRTPVEEEDPYEGPPDIQYLIVKKEETQHAGYFPVDLSIGWWKYDPHEEGLMQWDDGDFWIPIIELERQYRRQQPPVGAVGQAVDFMSAIDDFKNIKNFGYESFDKSSSNPLKIPNPTGDPLIERMIYEARQCLVGNYLYVACIKGIHRGKVFSMEGSGRSGWIRGTLAYTPERRMARNRVCGQSVWEDYKKRTYDISLDNCVIISK